MPYDPIWKAVISFFPVATSLEYPLALFYSTSLLAVCAPTLDGLAFASVSWLLVIELLLQVLTIPEDIYFLLPYLRFLGLYIMSDKQDASSLPYKSDSAFVLYVQQQVVEFIWPIENLS